jgi:Leucine-rich repeat (LRR) protein
MSATQPEPATPKPKRRWYQYSLRTLLLLVLVVSIGMSWLAVRRQRAKRHREAVETIVKGGGSVAYDWQVAQNVPKPKPPGPAWLRNLLGDDFFADVVFAIIQTDSEMEYVTTFARLEDLYLSGDRITDAALENLKRFPRLRKLTVSDNQTITGAGLANIKELTQLQALYVRYTPVGDAGSAHLEELTHLHTLYLHDTGITDAGLEHIKTLTQLKSLYLRESRVTDAGVRDLQNALPNCKIENSR